MSDFFDDDEDTTTFTAPDLIYQDKELRDPAGPLPGGIPAVHKPTRNEPWYCRVCHYLNVDSVSPFCISCGRDSLGQDGQPHPAEDKPPRAGLRSDGR